MVDRWTDGLMAYAVEERKPPEGLQKKRFVTRKRETESAVGGRILNEATVKRKEKRKRK